MRLVVRFISKVFSVLGVTMADMSETRISAGNGANSSASVDREQLLEALRQMIRARLIDEKAIVLFKQNKCHFQIGCAGHEAVQVAAAHGLCDPGHDWAYPYYRDMAFCAACGMTDREFLLSTMNKADDPNSGGRQMPMHYGHPDLRIVQSKLADRHTVSAGSRCCTCCANPGA